MSRPLWTSFRPHTQRLPTPTRRAIIARPAKGSATASELVELFAIFQPAVSWYLKVLEPTEAGSRLTLHNAYFVAQEACDQHNKGWSGSLGKRADDLAA